MMAAAPAHTESDMSSSKLKKALCRLSTKPGDLALERRALPADPADRLERLLQEIEEIVLPRSLWLQKDGKDVAAFHVINRQLSSVALIDDVGAQTVLQDKDANDLAVHVLNISKTVTSVRVTVPDPVHTNPNATSGVGVSALRSALSEKTHGCDVDRLARLLEPEASAQLAWSGASSEPDFKGDEKWRVAMETTTRHTKDQGSFDDKAVGGFAMPIDDQHVLIIASDGIKGICCVAPFAEGLRAIRNWQSVTPDH